MIQRLDNEYMMRSSECPGLKKLPGEYITDMFYASSYRRILVTGGVRRQRFELAI
jgi:hypothetical protein